MKISIEKIQEVIDTLISSKEEFAILRGVKVKAFESSGKLNAFFAEPVYEKGIFGKITDVYIGIGVPAMFCDTGYLVGRSEIFNKLVYFYVYHELVHAVQLYTGRLVFSADRTVTWEGKPFSSVDEIYEKYHKQGNYDDFPWEVEAYDQTAKNMPCPSKWKLFFASIKVTFLYAYQKNSIGTCIKIDLNQRGAYVHDIAYPIEQYTESLKKLVTMPSEAVQNYLS